MTITAFVQGLLAAAPLIGALLLLRVANVPRARRHQQYVLPAVAVVFAAAALIVLYRFNEWFDELLRAVFSLLPFLAGLYETRWAYLIENLVIVLVFLGVKYGYRALATRVFSGDRFIGATVVDQFYEYDGSSGRWFIRERLSQVRLFYRVLAWTSILITTVLLAAMTAAPAWPGFQAIAFPAIAVLVISEVFWAVDGTTKTEASDVIAGERDNASRRANYAALRKVFRQTFPSRVLDEGVDLSPPRGVSSHQALAELAVSESGSHRLFAEFFERAKRNGLEVDENLLHASLDLLHGRSVVINTPFYADLTSYLALPAYIGLLRGGKTLIVVGRDAGADDLVGWISDGLEGISGVPQLWDVQLLGDDARDGLDVGVLRAADLHNLTLLAANDAFFHEVETVLLVEPSRVLATGQLGLGIVVSRLARGQQPVFIAMDRNHDGLVDALSHLLKVNLTDVVATRSAQGASSEIVWSAEGPHLAGDILPGVARYLGIGTELAAVALKYHVSEVDWVGGDRFPVTDMSWIAGQYYRRINSFAELESSQRALSSVLRPQPNPLDIERAERRFLIVEDEFSNVYETLRLFASRSTESGFIHVISENYLLRDYMVGNRELFSSDPKAVPSIVADFARTPRNTVLRLSLMLSAFPVTESALVRELELAGWSVDESDGDPVEPPVIRMLKQLVGRFLGVSDAVFEQVAGTRTPVAGDDPERTEEPTFRLMRGSSIDRAVGELRSASFLVEDEAAGRDFIGACLHGHVHQTVLPGQFLTVGGKYYEVLTVGTVDRPAEVILRRAAEHITGRPAYRALRSFAIDSWRPADTATPRDEGSEIVVERVVVSLRVTSEGYLALPSPSDLSAARRVTVPQLGTRGYLEKDALRIAMPGATPRVRRTIALLLNELFVTVFPSGHGFVTALAPDPERTFGELLPEFTVDDDEAVYIVEDSSVDLGLIIAVERNWRRLLEVVTDYLSWQQQPALPLPPRPDVVSVFPDETLDEAVARLDRADVAQEAAAAIDPDDQPPWWRRVARAVLGWFRPAPARPIATIAASPPSTPESDRSLVIPAPMAQAKVDDTDPEPGPESAPEPDLLRALDLDTGPDTGLDLDPVREHTAEPDIDADPESDPDTQHEERDDAQRLP